MQRIRWCLLLAVFLTGITSPMAAIISPALEAQMQGLRGDDDIKVLVVLRDQADIATLDRQLHDARVSRGERHRSVLGRLQDAARRSQVALIDDLQARRGRGEVRGFSAHWLINTVVVVGTVDAVRELALRDDVLQIDADLPIELIAPVAERAATKVEINAIGIPPGIEAIGAPRVWRELGIDGSGVVVGIIDTGVDGNHPALGSRWRGHVADPAACWLDLIAASPDFPADLHGHGTHVMGTITGLAMGDTVGVAPGALWIATNPVDQQPGPEFDSDVLVALEWLADPDGDPETTDDVPCVVQNSWGVNPNLGYEDCYSLWWNAIDNCEASGVCLTWSAGNEGPGGESLRSPANRVSDAWNCFSVGATQPFAPYEISAFSSRGPSACGGEAAIKPEVCAPGQDIYSSVPGGGYAYMSGTSMAGPHVAGVVALMCAANPDLDVISIKQVLMDTAVDLGVAGEDNDYGHGLIDAYEAVVAVLDGMGTVTGTVTDSATGLPLAGVRIEVPARQIVELSDDMGWYRIHLPAGEHELAFAAFGYDGDLRSVVVDENQTCDGSVALDPTPRSNVSGLIFDTDGNRIADAEVRALDVPVASVFSAGDGSYALALPVGADYEIAARGNGLGADLQTVAVPGDVDLDFVLPELGPEDFELGAFVSYPWVMLGEEPWVIDDGERYEGQFSARTGPIFDNERSELEVTVNVIEAGEITFRYRVSTESNYDYFRFYVDGVSVLRRSGIVNWTSFSQFLAAGQHTLTWSYRKNESATQYDDACWIDLIELPPLAAVAYPSVSVIPAAITAELEAGETMELPLTLANAGEGELEFLCTVHYPGDPQPVAADAKEAGPGTLPAGLPGRRGAPPLAGRGGPDSFGYRWIDSDQANGPVFDWVDITGVGQRISNLSNDIYGPFDLGLVFRFYGVNQTAVRIATNGFLSFTAIRSSSFNWPIPMVDQPNDLIAPFWDAMQLAPGAPVYFHADHENGRFIAQWQEVEHFPYGNPETFEVILHADGSILYQYQGIDIDDGCTVGIENQDGTDGLQVLHDAGGYLRDGLAILFLPPAASNWLHVTPQIGTVAAGENGQLTIRLDATELAAATYTAELRLATNDPHQQDVSIPVALTVGDLTPVTADLPGSVRFAAAAPNPFNPLTNLRYRLPRDARVSLRLYDPAGRLVRTLVDEWRPAGDNDAVWNGTDDTGRRVASGSYIARLAAAGEVAVRRLTLVR